MELDQRAADEMMEPLSDPPHLATPEQTDLRIGPGIMKFRRYTSLDWGELAELMHVSRAQIFSLVSGKPASGDQRRHMEHLLKAIERADRGESRLNRSMLLERDKTGQRLFDLLKEGRYDEMVELAGPGNPRQIPEFPPPSAAEQEARRPPPPWVLMDALPGPYIPTGRGIPEKSFPPHKRRA